MTFFYSQGKIRMALFGIHILSIFPFQLSQMILAVGRYPLCKVYSTFLRNNNSIGTWKRMPPHFLVFSLGMVCLPGRYFFFLVESRTFSVLDSFKSLRAVRRRWRRYWEEPTNAHAAVVTLLYEWMGPVQSAARSFSPAGRFYFDAGRSYFQPPLHQQRRPNVKWNFAMDKHAAGNKSRTGSDSPENISEKKKTLFGFGWWPLKGHGSLSLIDWACVSKKVLMRIDRILMYVLRIKETHKDGVVGILREFQSDSSKILDGSRKFTRIP